MKKINDKNLFLICRNWGIAVVMLSSSSTCAPSGSCTADLLSCRKRIFPILDPKPDKKNINFENLKNMANFLPSGWIFVL
jgi:hypothetical protein